MEEHLMQARKGAYTAHLLRRAREQKGWTREHLAKLLDTNAFTIYRWESDRAFPRWHYRQKLAELFDCDLSQLGLTIESVPENAPFQEGAARPTTPVGSGSLRPPFPIAVRADELIGRESFLRELKMRLCEGSASTDLALYGLPGIGKTALAVGLACDPDIQQRFPDGILWASLGPHPDLLVQLGCWAGALGLPPSLLASCNDPASLGQALRASIGTRSMLLIIDDVWRIEDASALKVGGPFCSALLTTRFPLLAGQFAPQAIVAVPELTTEDGLHLLEHLAPDASTCEEYALRELVEAVGGLPFALVLMGRYLYLQSLSKQPRRIRRAIQQLRQREERFRLSLL